MLTSLITLSGFLAALLMGNRSLRAGLFAVIGIGYGYGLLRANLPDSWTYLTFDAAVLGLYASQLWRPISTHQRVPSHDLRVWLVTLCAWPVIVFFLLPSDSLLVELVGLRANVMLLPFLILGARLEKEDVWWLARNVALLNVAVVAVGVYEYAFGLEALYPRNEVTELIYRSKDLVGWTAHRIPATFSSAHAFAGTMVVTLPLLIGRWASETERTPRRILAAAVILSLLGIFMAAARSHMLTAAALVAIVTFTRGLSGAQRFRWVIAVGLVGYVVAGEERLQRFTTLQDTTFLSDRWTGSVNEGFFEIVTGYPLGNGLASGGTSVPYFVRRDAPTAIVGLENEYARIALEQGLPGLVLWLGFLLWFFTRSPIRVKDETLLSRRLVWVMCGAFFFSGMTGTGMLASVPQTVVMLILMGWVASARPAQNLTDSPTMPLNVAQHGALAMVDGARGLTATKMRVVPSRK